MKGWYGNRQAHALASRGIKSNGIKMNTNFRRAKTKDINIFRKDVIDFYGLEDWYEYEGDIGRHVRIIYNSKEYNLILNKIRNMINDGNFKDRNELYDYIEYLENTGEIKTLMSKLLYKNFTWFRSDVDIYRRRQERFLPEFNDYDETKSEFIERIEQIGRGDPNSLFYEPELSKKIDLVEE